MTAFDAVILAGGRASRMGGIDKPALDVGGTSLLSRVLSAVAGADLVVVVGPERDLGDVDIVQVQEDPPGGGPVAALAAGIRSVTARVVVVLGADMPSVDGAAVEGLVAGLGAGAVHGVVGVDEQGRDQYLCRGLPNASARVACRPDRGVARDIDALVARRPDAGAAPVGR